MNVDFFILEKQSGRQLQTQKRYSDGYPITKEPSTGTKVVQSILSQLYQDRM
jgi:hypothetical protein